MNNCFTQKTYKFDLCVVGGGMAGIATAITAARQGVKVALMHERPVYGGNASGEIRMWVCGSQVNGTREGGLGEEIALENLYKNPYKLYPQWDGILYGFVESEKNITSFMNCSCFDAKTENNRIVSVTGWQMTTQTFITIEADYFADCSGDSVLAPLSGAEFMIGRESKDEFDEDYVILEKHDNFVMSSSCLLQGRKLDTPIEYKLPSFVKRMDSSEFTHRTIDLNDTGENFWYLELGGTRDTIGDAEEIKRNSIELAFAAWDYIKNSGDFDAECWQLEFVGFLPAKRESRRMVGDYIMTSNDVLSCTEFFDTVAYGGWGIDDHAPEGFEFKGSPNRYKRLTNAYGIPYRCLYSKNIENLYFAGRNISLTHSAMSSARVMGTCLVLGEAVGMAVAVAKSYGVMPRGVLEHIDELQQRLLNNDCWLPAVNRRVSSLTLESRLVGNCENIELLRNGVTRNLGEENRCFVPLNEGVSYVLDGAKTVNEITLVFDSDLCRETLPGDWCERTHLTRCNILPDSPVMSLPTTLIKAFEVWVTNADGSETAVYVCADNVKRMVKIPLNKTVSRVTFVAKEVRNNSDKAAVFAFEIN